MQALKRFAEWYLGVPPADPGQGTAWNVSYKTPWPAWLPAWCLLLLCLALIAYVVWIYARDAPSVSWKLWLPMVVSRLAAVAALLLFLTELTLSVDRTGLPVIVVMIDVSATMGLEDEYPNAADEAAAEALIAEMADSAKTRLNLAKSLLTQHKARFLKRLLRRHKVRVYQFSKSAVPVGRKEYLRIEELDELTPLLAGLRPEGNQTRPGPAVRKVLDDLRGTSPSAIIILTDGITSTTDADKLTGVAELARSKLVPIFTIGIGSEEPSQDVQLYDLLVDEVTFVDDPINFSVKIKGYDVEGQQIDVVLREAGSSAELARKRVTAAADGEPMKLEISYTPPHEGEFDYTLEAIPLPKETNRDNNAETRHVSVRREKIRVLLADSQPRYEFRALKLLLERDPSIELHTVLQDADQDYAEQDQSAKHLRGRFPVKREDLFIYDVVIFGDLNLDYLSFSVLENLRDVVGDAGGGLIMIAGPNHNPLSYRTTPLEVMLPIQLTGAKIPAEDLPILEPFRPELTLDGRKGSGIFRFADNEDDSLQVWNSFPELYWLFEAPELQAGARVFAQHPTRTGPVGKLPVIVMQPFGAGKVIFHATDELWRWRLRVGDLYYGRYWVQAIRYLSRSKLLGSNRTAELTVDRLVYQQGDTVSFRVRFLDQRLTPDRKDDVQVMVERRGDVQRRIKLTQLTEAPSVFEGRLSHAAEGSYHAFVIAPSFNDVPPSADFRVEAPQRELQKRSLDRVELVQTAKVTHGKYYSLADAERLPNDVPTGQPVPLETQNPILLWNRWEILVLFALLLLSEWILRKRCRLV